MRAQGGVKDATRSLARFRLRGPRSYDPAPGAPGIASLRLAISSVRPGTIALFSSFLSRTTLKICM